MRLYHTLSSYEVFFLVYAHNYCILCTYILYFSILYYPLKKVFFNGPYSYIYYET